MALFGVFLLVSVILPGPATQTGQLTCQTVKAKCRSDKVPLPHLKSCLKELIKTCVPEELQLKKDSGHRAVKTGGSPRHPEQWLARALSQGHLLLVLSHNTLPAISEPLAPAMSFVLCLCPKTQHPRRNLRSW